jgi:hypothetical protein
MHQLLSLLIQNPGKLRGAVTQIADRDSGDKIQILATFLIPQVAATAAENRQIEAIVGLANVSPGLLHEILCVHGFLRIVH